MIEAIIPCVIVTPMDCFWDGSKALGPNEPIVIEDFYAALVPGLGPFVGELTWKNLDPEGLMSAAGKEFDLGNVGQLLLRVRWCTFSSPNPVALQAGLGDGYQSRPCLDPFDRECPSTAPNKVHLCDIIDKWHAYNNDNDTEPATRVSLEKEDVPPDAKEGALS